MCLRFIVERFTSANFSTGYEPKFKYKTRTRPLVTCAGRCTRSLGKHNLWYQVGDATQETKGDPEIVP